ncbi:MAG: class I SAM-dependent methyltransferase [Desulfobacteraceae bacterium]|nr:class I SAM-dependent methyltransferase [Desulfobacteraceae bacterium]
MESPVEEHYHSQNLSQKIQDALNKAGKDTNDLAVKDLAAVDQLHTGGAGATLALMEKTGLSKKATLPGDTHILDAGCGIGGSSRLLAKTFQYRVTGIDLAQAFIETARDITRWCKLEDYLKFEQGSVLDMPFETDSFDAILCQHILMNIQDKEAALKEFYRVLKPGGSLILHEIFQGENKPMALPVPWAGDPSISFLLTWEKFNLLLDRTNFAHNYFSNETKTALAWWQMVQAAGKNKKPRPLSPHLVFGSNAAFFAVNMQNNFQNNSIQCIEAVLKKS